MQASDRNLTPGDIQQINRADGVAAFFGALGYDTSARLVQTLAAMGIASGPLAQKIRHIERIANHDDGADPFEVYLVEMDSVTVAARRDLARTLRDRRGNFLLVLTSAYDQIDFVLVERVLPPTSAALGLVRVVARPRTLTVARQKPTRVDLRVLRRL